MFIYIFWYMSQNQQCSGPTSEPVLNRLPSSAARPCIDEELIQASHIQNISSNSEKH